MKLERKFWSFIFPEKSEIFKKVLKNSFLLLRIKHLEKFLFFYSYENHYFLWTINLGVVVYTVHLQTTFFYCTQSTRFRSVVFF